MVDKIFQIINIKQHKNRYLEIFIIKSPSSEQMCGITCVDNLLALINGTGQAFLGHAQIHKERMKGSAHEIDTAQTLKRLDGRLALLEKIRKTFTDSIPSKISYKIICSA